MPDGVFMAARAIVAAVLVSSAVAKAGSRREFLGTLRALGLSRPTIWWAALCVLEFAGAVAAVAAPPLPAAAVVGVLALAFAGAGVRALRSGTTVACACFGGAKRSPLGRRQVAALPAWLLAVALIAAWQPTNADQVSAIGAAAILLGLAPLLYALRRATLGARADRAATTGWVAR